MRDYAYCEHTYSLSLCQLIEKRLRNSKYECARWREEGSKRSHDKAMAELVKGEATWRGFWAEVKVLGGVEIDRRRAEAKGGAIYPGD
jgi:hypothetical protein